ncbi:Retrovirus-related Pol polyprotein from transposon 17.6 [Thelohanellus kitauei]|uniref:Retrovirus-related Pol polyprotein from transposon 17.6 n=1 Tax=Thelohanellus kitauei TaxID=669202 RepID=A0A0C2I626_THEKT|nr:Retrovirus-related Pol polyprotein from transposon 17.6 [Thelohanellus kitauei]
MFKNLPTLSFPSREGVLSLKCDASANALGAYLSQTINGLEKPIAFASRKLNHSERNYSTIDRELLALYWATKKFNYYLVGRHFFLYTDHNPLTFINSMKDTHNRRARMLMSIKEFDFTIRHISGSGNVVADGLSRSTYALKSDSRVPLDSKTKKDIIESYHLDLAHCGLEKTYEAMRSKMNWPNMYRDVKDYIQSCEPCLLYKHQQTPPKCKLVPIIPTAPLHTWHIDYIGPLPTTPMGNKYILLMVDQFTKWPEAVATRNQDAETTANIFMGNIVSRFGVPKKIITDQGRQFESATFKGLCEGLEIEKARTSAYHPQSNGIAERCVKTLKERLKLLCQDDTDQWDQKLNHALMALRFSKHCSTGFSPFELLTGHQPRTITDTKFCTETTESWRSESKFLNSLKNSLKRIHEKASKNITTKQEHYSKYYNKNIHDNHLDIQDIVARKSINQGSLSKVFIKPSVIVEKISQTNYKIRDLDPPHKSEILHHNRLKKLVTPLQDKGTEEGEVCNTYYTMQSRPSFGTNRT